MLIIFKQTYLTLTGNTILNESAPGNKAMKGVIPNAV